MPTTEKLTEFYRRVAFYRYHPGFQKGERDYKIRLASVISESRELIRDQPTQSLLLLARALHSHDDNIITWRLQKRLTDWFENDPVKAAAALRILWDEDLDLGSRFAAFAHSLEEVGLGQPGAQLVIGSTFLMALSPFDFPPVRMEAFKTAMEFAGRDTLYTLKSAVERYRLAQSFMDAIIEESLGFGIDLRDRLDAQGVIWCVADGWPSAPIPPDWVDDPLKRAIADDSKYSGELEELSSEPGGTEMPITEKQALIQARRGQGKFREGVLSFWGNCAVTECCELTLLRASHIKPWKQSENYERLDRYNGLLLAPNLDAAFDKGLITFGDDGQIIISPSLKAADRKALGIRPSCRLRRISPNHSSYLQYHRSYVFRKEKLKE
jgi:hypothetical protein